MCFIQSTQLKMICGKVHLYFSTPFQIYQLPPAWHMLFTCYFLLSCCVLSPSLSHCVHPLPELSWPPISASRPAHISFPFPHGPLSLLSDPRVATYPSLFYRPRHRCNHLGQKKGKTKWKLQT